MLAAVNLTIQYQIFVTLFYDRLCNNNVKNEIYIIGKFDHS